ncbi:hypothetical protein OF83DRAFT_601363 [Amylostereum chailletii]|nr:hypothetical protein OF83DRAFT_601363 [Amylostereum chailletii]
MTPSKVAASSCPDPVCRYSQEKNYPRDHSVADAAARNAENVMIGGGNVVINPQGKVLEGLWWGGEEALTADFNLIVRGKIALDVVGDLVPLHKEDLPPHLLSQYPLTL